MSKKTDEELIRIVSFDRHEYQPLGIEAAEKEIEKRKISTAIIDQIKNEVALKVEATYQFDAMKVGSSIRFIHLIIDTVCVYILAFMLLYFYGYFAVKVGFSTSVFSIYIILIIGYLSYYIFMENKYQKTVGKFITKTKVVTKNGSNKPSLNDIIRRTVLRLIPYDYFSFLITNNGFHDRLSETTLVKDDFRQTV